MSTNLSQLSQTVLNKLATDYRYFAAVAQKIIGKGGGAAVAFTFNSAQLILHAATMLMWKECGYVRIIVVKGRQQGISTYIEGLFHWLALFLSNFTVCILSHESKSTQALFDKVAFFHENLPPQIKPDLLASNRHELKFANGSKYMVFTAGAEDTGRSQTAQAQHQSERAFFINKATVDAGVGQIVALLTNTFIFKESTGNGMDEFYQEVLDALAGRGIYRVVFIPYHVQHEYRTKPRTNFTREPDEQQLVDLYNLDDAQLQWRRDKIVELKSLRKFKQEYPNTLMEAFQASGDSFYDADLVTKARQSKIKGESFSPLILGVDPGREGDRTVLVFRKGREVKEIIKYDTMDQMRLAGIIADLIVRRSIDRVFIDYGMGHGTIDRLRERHFGSVVEGIYFGEQASDSQYLNKRAEMAFAFDDWLKDGEVSLPDDDDMSADIAAMPDYELTSNSRKKFPSKDEIKKNYGRSPDILDAIMLTFAYPVASKEISEQYDAANTYTTNTKNGSELSTVQNCLNNRDGVEIGQHDDFPWYGEKKHR